MRPVVFGLTVSSSWGIGHATLWRGLEFFERDPPWHAAHRDLTDLPGGTLPLYGALQDVGTLHGYHEAHARLRARASGAEAFGTP